METTLDCGGNTRDSIVGLDIDRDGAFDYETCESKNFGLNDYIRMVQEMSEVIRKERMAFLEKKVTNKTE